MLQSYHAGFNYCNRNATTDVSTLQLLGGYVGAVSSAIAVAYKLRTTIAKSKRYPPPQLCHSEQCFIGYTCLELLNNIVSSLAAN